MNETLHEATVRYFEQNNTTRELTLADHLAAAILKTAPYTMRSFIRRGEFGVANFSATLFCDAQEAREELSAGEVERVIREGDYSDHLDALFDRVREMSQRTNPGDSPDSVGHDFAVAQIILAIYRAVPPSSEIDAARYAIDSEYSD